MMKKKTILVVSMLVVPFVTRCEDESPTAKLEKIAAVAGWNKDEVQSKLALYKYPAVVAVGYRYSIVSPQAWKMLVLAKQRDTARLKEALIKKNRSVFGAKWREQRADILADYIKMIPAVFQAKYVSKKIVVAQITKLLDLCNAIRELYSTSSILNQLYKASITPGMPLVQPWFVLTAKGRQKAVQNMLEVEKMLGIVL